VRSVFFFFIVFNGFVFSQISGWKQIDSLFNSFIALRCGARVMALEEGINRESRIMGKCGTILALQIKDNFSLFTSGQQAVLKTAQERPLCDTSVVSPGKNFRVHFNKSGAEAPLYSVEEFAKSLDSAYSFEVGFLRYPAPAKDFGMGGDDLYDVYIIGLGNYGVTYPETEITPGSGLYSSYICVDNAFGSTSYTHGIEAAKVTGAHELHHAIQIANYGSRGDMRFFMELTATSMEEFVFSDVNDYYNYIRNYFAKSWISFNRFNYGVDGYELAHWNLYQKKKFGYDIIKREWEITRNFTPLTAINKALEENNSSFMEAYNEFGQWCCFTGNNAKPGEYFDEAESYPQLQPISSFNFAGDNVSAGLEVYPASNNPLVFINPIKLDTLVVIITNGDIAKADISNLNSDCLCSLNMSSVYIAGYKKISSRYFSNLNAAGSAWMTSAILNGLVSEGNIAELPWVDYPFPSPFSYKDNSMMFFPITNADAGNADLYIYNSAMTKVFSGTQAVNKYLDKKVVRWNVLDNSGRRLPTGVYFYMIKTSGNTIKGKCSVICN